MCIAIIILNYSPKFPLIVCHNREEDPLRSTSDLGVRDNILSAIDLKAGGVAAVGLNVKSGNFAILTNCRRKRSTHRDGESRGTIVRKVLAEGCNDSNRRWTHSTSFQGEFHLYFGNAFVESILEIEYLTNIAENKCERICFNTGSGQPMRVIVRMNEHPASHADWNAKLDWVKEAIIGQLSANKELASVDAIITSIEGIISRVDPISASDSTRSYAWSPIPEAEIFLQSNIIIPTIEVSSGVSFATVSQTIIISDRESREVSYLYRRVSNSERRLVEFAPWERKLVHY